MTVSKINNLDCFIQELHFYYLKSNKIFTNYQANKILLHASLLKKANENIVRVLNSNILIVTSNSRSDIVDLLIHYEIWMTQFEEHLLKLDNPNLSSTFVFERLDHAGAFPREAMNNLLALNND